MSKGDAESIHYMEKARDMENGGERERKKKTRFQSLNLLLLLPLPPPLRPPLPPLPTA